jgi:MerR family copper efflux transcriptional regulator
MLIGELATLTGASTRSLRHYEKLGIIKSRRTENSYRHYSEDAVEYVKAVRFLICSGLTLCTIADILPALMNQECKLTNLRIRTAIEREASKIKTQMDQLNRSYSVLTAALGKGHIRRPGT